MKEMFDLDYLSKDLTGNSEIQSAIDRCLAFMKLEKWEKSLQIIEDLTDMHPESPAAWFTRARLATNDFTIFTLATPDGRKLVAEASESLQATMTFADEERKDEYQRFQAVFSDRMKKDLVNTYVNAFVGLVDSFENLVQIARYACPKKYDMHEFQMFKLCESFNQTLFNEDGGIDENTIYSIPPEIIAEVGKDYPSISFAAVHVILMNEAMKSYFEAEKKRNKVIETREYRYEVRRQHYARQGFNLDSDDIESINAKLPLYDLCYYFKYSTSADFSLAKLIKENSVFEDAAYCDEKVKDVFSAYFRLLDIMEIPIGNLIAAGVPEVYYKEVEEILYEKAEKEREQKQLKAIAEHEEEVKREEERKEAAAIKAVHNSKRIKLLFVCLFFGTFGVHNFMMGEKKKGAMKILLFWTGLSSLIATVDFFKLLFDTYAIP